LLVFISVFYGKHIYFKGVRTFRGKKVSIRSSIPLFVHADGEHIGQTPLTIELLPGAIRVLTKASETKDKNLKDWGAESGV
jgi:diacylglycerol kinase family enzyme